MMAFAQGVAKQIQSVTHCRKVAVLVLGLEVNHAHIHLVPINTEGDIDLKHKLQLPDGADSGLATRSPPLVLVSYLIPSS